jgi:hypothetical protein
MLMAKARELKTLRVNDLRIMAFESIDGILPFQQEGGEVKRLTFSTDPGKRRTFAEWENFEEGIKSYIGHPTPDGFIGIARKEEDFDAYEQRQKRDAQRHNEKKQIAASIISRAILSLLTDERIAQNEDERAIQQLQKTAKPTRAETLAETVKSIMTTGSRTEFRDQKKVLELAAAIDAAGIKPKVQCIRLKGPVVADPPATYSEVAKNRRHPLYTRLFSTRGTLARYL